MEKRKGKKAVIIVVIFTITIVVYYLYAIKPLDASWKYCISVMAGKVVPAPDDEIEIYYRMDKYGFPDSTTVELTIHRYFIYRWRNQIKMVVRYSQDYYSADGSLLHHASNAAQWVFTKVEKEWILTDINPAQA